MLYNKNITKQDIDHTQIATALSTNKTYLFDAVKAVTGKTPSEYINSLRADEARKMLDSRSGYTILAIASECGFNLYRTFQRLFRKSFQLSPVEYSKLVKTDTGEGFQVSE